MLTGPQIGQLREAVREVFTREEFDDFLFTRLGERLERYSSVLII